jgi:small subunit ribosomal protein S6
VVRDYELMYIVRPDLDDEALHTVTESVDALIAGLGGSVGKTTLWGKRRLAYEVDRLRDGHYVITLLQLDGERVTDLERALTIHDTVFRHLLVRRDETSVALDDVVVSVDEDGDGGDAATRDGAGGAADDDLPAAEDEDIPEAEIAAEDEE